MLSKLFEGRLIFRLAIRRAMTAIDDAIQDMPKGEPVLTAEMLLIAQNAITAIAFEDP